MTYYHRVALIATADDDSGVTTQVAPLPAGSATGLPQTLNAIDCPAAGTCVAVGSLANVGSGGPVVIQTLAAGTWAARLAPLPLGATSNLTLTAVSCGAASTCTATGTYRASTTNTIDEPLIVKLDGANLTSSAAPEPPDSTGAPHLASLSCSAANRCVAVGTYPHAHGQQALLETYSDGQWTAAPASLPSNTASNPSQLDTVACGSPTSCAATGRYQTQTSQSAGLLEAS